MDPRLENQLLVGGLFLIILAIALIAEWWERRTESPVMKTRVNEASDQFLLSRGSIWEAARRSTRQLFTHREAGGDE